MTKLTTQQINALEPAWENLLVKIDKPPAKTAGGLYVPETYRKREQSAHVVAEILAAGPHAFKIASGTYPNVPSVGDKVIISQYAGHPLLSEEDKLDKGDKADSMDTMYRIVNHLDIVARIV